ncbi:MAG: YbaK/EbsC family protein [Clostridia bacterium]|nr:YbaK/EbsC family protein [Clostridia bacterium]
MSLELVREHLRAFGLEDRIHLTQVSSATVELAAQALGIEPERIAKTLSFLMKEGCLMVVAAGDARIDNGKFKRTFGEKAHMLPHDLVEEMTGHPVGGVCPFAVKAGVRVYLDESLKRFDTVYPAAGTGQSGVELHLDELQRASGALGWVDVCKDWQ